MAADVHAKDLRGNLFQLGAVMSDLNAAGFAAAADLNLRFADQRESEIAAVEGCKQPIDGIRRNTFFHRETSRFKQLSRLIFH